MTASSSRHCRRCGEPLDQNVRVEACPRCMLLAALDSDEEAWTEAGDTPGFRDLPTHPKRLGNYLLLDEIGRGGMGIVFRARQLALDRTVAVKTLLLGPLAGRETIERFRREATAAAALRHPNIVEIHEVGESGGHPYFSMDYVEGRSLAEIIAEQGNRPSDYARAAEWVRQIAEALEHAHQHGILHRDIKPANILIDSDDRPLVMDFGLARWLNQDSSLTLSGQTLGSPSYMPPELAAGQNQLAQAPSDVYSAGAVLYELLTGRPPFLAESVQETLLRIRDEPPIAPRMLHSGIPRDLETICLKCLEKEPLRRYATAQALAEDLGRHLRRQPILARPVGPVALLWRWCFRKPALAGMLATVVVIVTAGFVGILSQWRRAERAVARETANVRLLELQVVEQWFAENRTQEGLASLARILRLRPDDRTVAERLVSEMTHRNWPLPVCPPLNHPDETHDAELSPDGTRLVTVSLDNKARLWNTHTGRLIGSPMEHDAADLNRSDFLGGLKPMVARFSPDGSRLVTGATDCQARVWDGDTGEPLTPPLRHADWVTYVQFSPNGQWIATACRDGTIQLWDASSGEPRGEPFRHTDWVNFCEFSPDGQLLFTGADDGTAQVWNLTSGQPVGRRIEHQSIVKAGAFSPDSQRVATASKDRTAQIWDALTGEPLSPPLYHENQVVTVNFSPDGGWLATAGFDQTVRLWEGTTGSAQGRWLIHDGTIRSVRFSPDGTRALTASEDGTARLWDYRTGQEITEPLRHDGAVWSARFNHDGTRVVSASSDRTCRLWDVRPGAALPRHLVGDNKATGAAWSPDGRWAAVEFWSPGVFDAGTGALGHFLRHIDGISDLVFSPDSARALTVTPGWKANLWDVEQGTVLTQFRHRGQCLYGSFSHNGKWIVTCSQDGTASIWSATSYVRLGRLPHDFPVLQAVFTPDDRQVLTLAGETLRLWHWATSTMPLEWATQQSGPTLIDISENGHRILSAAEDGTVRLWTLDSAVQAAPPLRHRDEVTQARFSPDGSRVLTGSKDRTAYVWDAEHGTPLAGPLHHRGPVTSARFSPDGRRIITASQDGAVRLWDAWTGQVLASPFVHPLEVNDVVFSPEGRYVLSACEDREGRIFEVVPLSGVTPAWLPALAEAVCQVRLEADWSVTKPRNFNFFSLQQQITSRNSSDPYSIWAKWFLADRSLRQTGPSTPWTVEQWAAAEKAKLLVRESSNPSTLSTLLMLRPRNGLFYAQAARSSLALYRTSHVPLLLREAEWQAERACTLAPSQPAVWWVRAQVQAEHQDMPRALSMLQKASRLGEAGGTLWLVLAEWLAADGQAEAALQAFTAALNDQDRHPPLNFADRRRALLRRAAVHLQLGNPRRSREDREAAYDLSVPSRAHHTPPQCLDLSEFYNANLDGDWLGTDFPSHNLANLPSGCVTLDEIPFDVRGAVQTANPTLNTWRLGYPDELHFPVGRQGQKIHFLHAAGWLDPAASLPEYQIRLETGEVRTLPLTYGLNIGAWDDPWISDLPEATIAWQGTNAAAQTVRLYHATWTNTEPAIAIDSIHVVPRSGNCVVLVVGVTLE